MHTENTHKNYRYVYKRLFQYILRYRSKLVILIMISLAGVTFEIAKPLPVKLIIDQVLSNHKWPAFLAPYISPAMAQNKQAVLIALLCVLVLLTIGSAVISYVVFNYTVRLSQRLVHDLSIDFFAKLQQLTLSFYSKNHIGDLLERMNGDVFVVYFLVAQILLPVFSALICLIGMFYVMVKVDMVLALIAFSVVPLLGISLLFFTKPMNETTMKQYKSHGMLSAIVQQSLVSIKVIQAFGRESYMLAKVRERSEVFSRAFRVANNVSMTYNQLSQLVTGLAAAVVISVGAFRGLHGNLSVGDLFIFLGYITALYGPVNSLSTAIGTAVTLGARGKRIFDIIDSHDIVKEKPDAHALTSVKGAVDFENVTFGYNTGNARPTLKDISFSASPGQITGIVGPTGAGKTTMISLLTRFYDPLEGQVKLDGIDLKDLQLHSLRENISVVLQDALLFPMTIAENIAFGNPEATMDEIKEAAERAQAHEFILKLPDGYNTMLSENGTSLSGGQRQRIALARAFVKQAPILILDEPTSALDSLTEARIFEALHQYANGRTVFLISHRLSSLKHADQIITIKDGALIEKGTHQSLLNQNRVYADLYKHQHIN